MIISYKIPATFLVMCVLAVLSGCASGPSHPPAPLVTDVYDAVHREGARDTVKLLREGLRAKQVYGAYDPYIPLRQPDEIIPVWIPAHKDPITGRNVQGHWENSVVKWSDWYTQ